MKPSILLIVDAAINLILGVLLMAFPFKLVVFLGIPPAAQSFYPNILGAVLFGIGLALLMEYFRGSSRWGGLGLAGAIAINLCGGFVLIIWLISGNLSLPLRGQIILWSLAVILVGLSTLEGIVQTNASRP